ncbi:Uncharacterized protein GBIM_10814 [Gryllus bimaculatus]|nr:Uncharacterized protein GBIM_10814 [Gryllus bimaculatus]
MPQQKDGVLHEALQRRLKHFSVGFDALAVALQHTLSKVEMLEKDEKHADYNIIKREWKDNKVLLDDMKCKVSELESSLEEKNNSLSQLSREYEELIEQKQNMIEEKRILEDDHRTAVSSLKNELQMQVELNNQYAAEQTKLVNLYREKESNLISEYNQKEEKARKEHEDIIAQMRQEFLQLEENLKFENSQIKDDNERMKKQLAIFSEADNKDSRLQASITRCNELEEEVRSLQSVLELKHQELQELRKNNGSLTRQAEQLPSALQRVTVLEARVEDLQAQLKDKGDVERQASQQQIALVEALQKEVNHKNRLALLTEELQWKLKQNAEVFSALVAMNGTSANIQVPSTSGTSSPAVSRKNTNGLLHSISESASPAKADCETPSRLSVSSLMKRVSNSSYQTLRPDMSDEISSPPSSPKIKGIVEKNDSVSWVLDMEESSKEFVTRLVRRAGSFRGATPPPSGSSPRTQTLPTTKRRYKSGSLSLSSSSSAVFRRSNSKNDNSVSCSDQDRDRTEHFGSARSRSHSVSADSVDSVDIINWGLNISDSYNKIPENNHEIRSQDNKLLISVKNSGSKTFIPHTIHNEMDMILTNNLSSDLEKDPSENGEQNWNCNMPDFSNDESPTKSSGSSAYTSSDEDVRNNIDGKNITSNENYCHSETSSHLQNVLPFNALNICGSPNTADLSLLAACAAAQPALMPKDAAGEAMISEETSEDENDRDEVDDRDETVLYLC